MKAITLKENGGIENLILSEVDMPKIKDDEVLIKVNAISINPVDAAVRKNKASLQGILRPAEGETVFILGWDIAGIIEEVGEGVSEFKKGSSVFGMVNFPGHGKAYAEYVAAPANQLALKPENISFEEAAAGTLAALTAWQALVTYSKVQKGDKVLIHAAAGGVGHYAVQIAKYLGAYVAGTASSVNREFVLSLGADEFIDYTSENFEERVKDADVVLDSLATGGHLLRSLNALKNGGRLISIKSNFDDEFNRKAKEKNIYTHRLLVVSSGDDMKKIAGLFGEGKLRSHISEKYMIEDLPQAHKQIETGKTRGKIVVVL